jgi:nitrogen fixation protein NifU and related proteins
MLSAMYQERLLAEYRAPKHRREMPDATGSAERKNPVCGDAIRVMVRHDNGHVADVSFTGHGCSIAVASASLLTQVVTGLDRLATRTLITQVESMLAGQPAESLPDLLAPLRGAVPFPARHGCVLMPWLALRDALG